MQLLRRPARKLRRPRQRSLVAFAVVLVALIACPAAQAAEKGLSTDLTWGISAADQDHTAAVVQDSGAKWALITVAWRDVEYEGQGMYDAARLATIDRSVNLLRQAGTNVIVTVFSTPPWASAIAPPDTGARWDPPNPGDYATFMTFLANRYKDKVSAYEIWNEPDLSPQRFWNGGPDPPAYAALLKAAYPAVKAGDPNAKVLSGGTQFNDYQWLEQLYAAEPTIGQYFDVMATHPYPPQQRAPEDVKYCTGADYVDVFCPNGADGQIRKDSFSAYRKVREVLLAHGDNKPIWFTEVGWSTATSDPWGVSEATQADYLTRAYRYIEADPYVQVAIWYTLRNLGESLTVWDDQLGLLHTDFSPKPSWSAFRALYPPPDVPADPDAPAGPAGPTGPTVPAASKQATTTSLAVRVLPASARRALSRRRPRRTVVVTGRVLNAVSGTTRTVLERRRKGHRPIIVIRTRHVDSLGRFTIRIALGTRGRWRVRSSYRGTTDRLASSSRWRSFVLG